MFAYARLTPGAGFRPDRALKYYAQRFVGVPAARRGIASLIAAGLRRGPGRCSNVALGPAAVRTLYNLEHDGLALMTPLIAQDRIDRMVDYFFSRRVVGPDDQTMPLEDLPAGVSTAAYPLDTVLDCPGMLEALNAPEVLAIGAQFLGCKPTVSSVGVRWSFPKGGAETRSQEYHRDLDDWRFFKLFIYLTDVDETSGPHSFVRGSHKTAFGMTAKAYHEDALVRRYGREAVTRIVGPRGTTFLADTIGIHCGLAPTRRPRLILQIQYSLLPIYAFLYQPAKRSGGSFDPYCNRLLIRQDS